MTRTCEVCHRRQDLGDAEWGCVYSATLDTYQLACPTCQARTPPRRPNLTDSRPLLADTLSPPISCPWNPVPHPHVPIGLDPDEVTCVEPIAEETP